LEGSPTNGTGSGRAHELRVDDVLVDVEADDSRSCSSETWASKPNSSRARRTARSASAARRDAWRPTLARGGYKAYKASLPYLKHILDIGSREA
jgi:hypothetical protein